MKNRIVKLLFSFRKDDSLDGFLSNYVKVIGIYCPVSSLVFVGGFSGFEEFWQKIAISMSISMTVGTTCMLGSKILWLLERKYYHLKKMTPPQRGLIWGVFASYFFLVPGLYFGFKLAGAVSFWIGRPFSGPSFENYREGIVYGMLVSGAFLLFELIREAKSARKEAEAKAQKLENERLKAQVSALSAQLNPHLLFNSLNTIAATISENPDTAERMTVQLSDLYRGVLKSAKDEIHSLSEELSLCRSYLEIERNRFGERVKYEIVNESEFDLEKVRVPVLLLQPLVENAVKHGLTPKKDGGSVRIVISSDEKNLSLKVIDNGVGAASVEASTITQGTQTGLSNSRSRIDLRFGEEADFEFSQSKQGTQVSLMLPLKEVINA